MFHTSWSQNTFNRDSGSKWCLFATFFGGWQAWLSQMTRSRPHNPTNYLKWTAKPEECIVKVSTPTWGRSGLLLRFDSRKLPDIP